MDGLQRDYRVTLAGPTTLLAMLNSLHMGFRTLALEQQASEVWKVLGAVKTEFERYGELGGEDQEQVRKASDTLDNGADPHQPDAPRPQGGRGAARSAGPGAAAARRAGRAGTTRRLA